jgi:uncharacterized OsmC-like protein
LLVGHSLGGAAVLAAAAAAPEATAVATIGAPTEPSHVEGVFDPPTLDQIRVQGSAEVQLAGRPFTITQQFIDDISEARIDDAVASLDKALLIFHSPVDEVVHVDHARRLFDRARHPKSFVSLDGADHLLTDRADARFVAEVLGAWVDRYVPVEQPDSDSPPEGRVVVEETDVGKYAQRVLAGRHTLRADEPIGIGDDTGPTPYEYVLAGLGACTSMTLRMYAERRGISLEHVRVTMRHLGRHSDDCIDDVDGRECSMESIERQIALVGDLSGDDVERLTRIADRCPVHRTLEGGLQIVTEVTN